MFIGLLFPLSMAPVASSGEILVTTGTGLNEYSMLAVSALFPLLFAKQILSASDLWNKEMKCSLDMAIFPLLISLLAIVLFEIGEII